VEVLVHGNRNRQRAHIQIMPRLLSVTRPGSRPSS
jgi:hypothetical protein